MFGVELIPALQDIDAPFLHPGKIVLLLWSTTSLKDLGGD